MCLLSVVFGEAQGEPEIGKQAVAHVLVNRADRANKSVCEVSRQKGQFRPRRPPPSFKFSINDADPTDGAMYFRNYPGSWGKLKFVKKIGQHYFYKP